MIGTIEGVVFLGESTTYLVRVDGVLMRAKQFLDASAVGTSVGTPVVLSWLPRGHACLPGG